MRGGMASSTSFAGCRAGGHGPEKMCHKCDRNAAGRLIRCWGHVKTIIWYIIMWYIIRWYVIRWYVIMWYINRWLTFRWLLIMWYIVMWYVVIWYKNMWLKIRWPTQVIVTWPVNCRFHLCYQKCNYIMHWYINTHT